MILFLTTLYETFLICLKKCLHYLYPTVLRFQQVSEWLKLAMTIKVCGHEDSPILKIFH